MTTKQINDLISFVAMNAMNGVAAKFNTSTAALLAYTRGYLGGMDANNRYEQDGTEALGLLGLRVLPNTDLVD